MIVPNPGRAPYPSPIGPSGVPTPLSETTSLQPRFSRLIGNDNQAWDPTEARVWPRMSDLRAKARHHDAGRILILPAGCYASFDVTDLVREGTPL